MAHELTTYTEKRVYTVEISSADLIRALKKVALDHVYVDPSRIIPPPTSTVTIRYPDYEGGEVTATVVIEESVK